MDNKTLKRLRDPFRVTPQDAAAAADEIERLREALKWIAYPECITDEAIKMWEMVKHARSALEQKGT